MQEPQSGRVEIVRRMIDALNRADVAAALACASDDIVVDWSESIGFERGVFRGHDEAARLFRSLFAEAFDEWHIEPSRFLEIGSDVVVGHLTAMRGRDGINVEVRTATIYTVEDELIARMKLYQDVDAALAALDHGP